MTQTLRRFLLLSLLALMTGNSPGWPNDQHRTPAAAAPTFLLAGDDPKPGGGGG